MNLADPLDFDLLRIASGKTRTALRWAAHHHAGQVRKSNPAVEYWQHLVFAMLIGAGVGADRNLIVALILHDIVEDTPVTFEQVEAEFGTTVRLLVEAVTKDKTIDGLPLPERAAAIEARLLAVGIPAVALKACDLLANTTDVVLDAEEGIEPALIFKEHKWRAKCEHYVELGERLHAHLIGTDYERLAVALMGRIEQLRAIIANDGVAIDPPYYER